ncbi:RelA/SpoT family protein [Limosilactobacillus equigenerosi]|nr:bifunctional (p)ppGpp synthetase/guanosine-3',5'-bis(diphosphate) 3'-pyrophosphohydrolase [Limosilactobacillus equigenerosi]
MSKIPNLTHEDVRDICASYMNEEHVALVEKAYRFAMICHKDQRRKSGELYIIHPIQVAGILANLHMDPETVCAGYMHDIVEDTGATLSDIETIFGSTIAMIIDGDTKISKIHYKSDREQMAETHRKLLLAMSQDIRVMIVKLADRLHNMRTLDFLRPEKQARISRETLQIYAPIADRLGISTMKWELEDLSLRYIDPDQYFTIVKLMNSRRDQRLDYIDKAIQDVKQAVAELELTGNVEIYGRPKHIYSIYRKMVNKHKQFSEIYDLLAIRVVVDTIPDCYAVLGAIHTNWKPMPGRFKDYIAMPKTNGYQSLHTTVIGPDGQPLEIQIRTHEMHEVAEFGVAAHWAYKEGKTNGVQQTKDSQKLNVVKEILELRNETQDTDDFMSGIQSDVFADKVYAFTPKGDVIEMPVGAGPLDMAYLIHTEVGNKTTGAKVNGRIVPLDYDIKNGDIVDIITSNNSHPSHDWLDLVSTRRAKNKIRQYFRMHDREQNIETGRRLVDQQIREAGYEPAALVTDELAQQVATKLHYNNAEEMFAAVGFGDISAMSVRNRLTETVRREEKQREAEAQAQAILENHETLANEHQQLPKSSGDGIIVEGVDNLLTRLSHCCKPIPGDEILGYITMGRGVSVHRIDCPNIKHAEQTGQRIVTVYWENPQGDTQIYDTDIEVRGDNRSGLVNEVLRSINSHTRYLTSINGKINSNNIATINATVGVRSIGQLNIIMKALSGLTNVDSVRRVIH